MEGAVTDRHYARCAGGSSSRASGRRKTRKGRRRRIPRRTTTATMIPRRLGWRGFVGAARRGGPPSWTRARAHPVQEGDETPREEGGGRARAPRARGARPGDGAFGGPSSVRGFLVRAARTEAKPRGSPRARDPRRRTLHGRAVIDQLATRAPDQHAELELSIASVTNDSDDLASIGKIRARARSEVAVAARRTTARFCRRSFSTARRGDWDAYRETVRERREGRLRAELERRRLARALKRPIEVFAASP